MALLKIVFKFSALASLGACGLGGEVTEIVSVPIKSDTFISSDSLESQGGEKTLRVSTLSGVSSRALISLPSSDGSTSERSFIQAIVDAIFDGIFEDGCDESLILKPQYLSSVKLVLTPLESAKAALAPQLSARPLARGWWQGATWERAHPFLSSGRWDAEGADVLDSFAAVVGVAATNTVEFEVKDLVTESQTLYDWGRIAALNGFRIETVSGEDFLFHSAQSDWGEGYGPHLDFVYTGPCIPHSQE